MIVHWVTNYQTKDGMFENYSSGNPSIDVIFERYVQMMDCPYS